MKPIRVLLVVFVLGVTPLLGFTLLHWSTAQAQILSSEGSRVIAGDGLDLIVSQSASAASVLPGNQLTYTLSISNAGSLSATQLVVTDSLPLGVLVESLSPDCAHHAGQVVCTQPLLPSQEEAVFTVGVWVPGRLTGTLTNLVTAVALEPDLVPANNTASLNTPLVGQSCVYVQDFEGTVGSEWSTTTTNVTPTGNRHFLGQFGNTTITLTLQNLPNHQLATIHSDLYVIRTWDGNNGPDLWAMEADGQSLLYTTFNTWGQPGNNTQAYPGTYPGGNYPYHTGAIEINSLGYTYNNNPYDAVYGLQDSVVHTAPTLTVSFSGSNLQQLSDESWGLDNVQVCLQAAQAPDLWLTQKAEPMTAAPGDPILYTLTFTNEGNLPATGIILTDIIPSGVLYTSYASSGVLVTATGSIPYVWQVSRLEVGQDARVRINGYITPSFGTGVLTNTAVIHTLLPESHTDNNQATVVTLVREPIDLQVRKTASAGTVLPSSPLTYTVWVTNAGPGTAHEVLVTDDLPAGVVLLATPPGCSLNDQTLLCPTAVLSNGHTLSYTYGVWVPGLLTGTLTNTVQVTAVESELVPTTNSASTTTIIYPSCYYRETFDGLVGSEWLTTTTSTTPVGAHTFLGELGNESLSLSLHNLPPHQRLEMSLELLVIRSWDGSDLFYGPDIWQASVDGQVVRTTTFANNPLFDQAYPGTYPLQSHPGYTGATEVNTLGYTFNNQAQDALYDISLTVPHTGTSLMLELGASGLSELSEESWGVDNVKICLGQPLTYIPFLRRP